MRNYQREMDARIDKIRQSGVRPALLLHSCCAPCSSAVLERLCNDFRVTVFYYNPNIFPESEYLKRKREQIRLIDLYRAEGREIDYMDGEYDYGAFLEIARGAEDAPEGGERCERCFRLRLQKTRDAANAGGYMFFTTTLTISPHKNAEVINQIGLDVASDGGAEYLVADFKKRDGYKRSIALSREYDLYRQNYCGCAFGKRGEGV